MHFLRDLYLYHLVAREDHQPHHQTCALEMDANLNAKVTDYLLKRGFNRTEEIFRQESKHLGPDGKPLQQLANIGPKKYAKAFNLLHGWVENNLDIYKVSSSYAA